MNIFLLNFEFVFIFSWIFFYLYFYCTVSFAAANESCPQPQTSEHLAAIDIMKLNHILILQNKIDLCRESQLREQQEKILEFVRGEILSFLFFLKGLHVSKKLNIKIT